MTTRAENRRTPPVRATVSALGTVLLAAALAAACDNDPSGVDAAFAAAPCPLPDVHADPAVLDGLTADHYRAALLDADARLVGALPHGPAADELRGALLGLESSLATGQWDTSCRLAHIAADALDRQPDLAETRADRSALRLVVDVVVAALTIRP